MEELIGQQAFDGIIDYTLSEIIGAIGGGFHIAGDDRREAAGRAGLPQIVVPGCIDFLVFGARHDVPAALQSRPSYFHNPEFTRFATSEKGDAAVIDGAKSMAMTALDLMFDPHKMASAKNDFDATAELSRAALARTLEAVQIGGHHHSHGGHGGCGCAR